MTNILEKIDSFVCKYKTIILIILLFPCFRTDAPKYFGIFYEIIFDYLVWPFAFIVIIDYFLIKKIKPSKLMCAFLLYQAWLVVDQLRIRWLTLYDYSFIARGIILGLLIEINVKGDFKKLIKAFLIIFECLIYINTITIVINLFNGTQHYADNFLGYYNNIIVFVYPAICVASLYIYSTKKWIRGCFLIFVSIVSVFLSLAATPRGALIASIAVFIFEFLLYKINKKEFVKLWPLVVIALLFNVFIVVIYREGLFPLLDNFIINILHRSTNFTGRSEIWDKAIELAKEASLFGFGYTPEIQIGSFVAAHAHNELLAMWIRYGLVGVGLYAVFSFIYIREIDRQNCSIIKIIFISLVFGIFLGFIADRMSRAYLYYIIFFFAYHFKTISENKE